MPVSVAAPSHQRTTITRKPQDQTGLNVAVVRLLALALDISGGWSPAPPAAGLLVPFGYRDWPSLTSLVEARTGSQQLRFYVSPKALLTPDYESFPVGTVFVVESEPLQPATGWPESLPAVFVMEKCAGMTMNDGGSKQCESWIYASWDPAGLQATAVPEQCGICRLPWLTPASA